MKIIKAEYIKGASKSSEFPVTSLPEFMLCGRSNVGKSSFINMIAKRKNLAHTSGKPGKTQCLNFFFVNDAFYMVDVPGYGFANTSKEIRNKFGIMIDNYLRSVRNLKFVFQLIDFRHKPTEDDILMYNYLRHLEKNVILIATKKDKVKRSDHQKNTKIIHETLKLTEEDKLIVVSSETKEGLEEVYGLMEKHLTGQSKQDCR